ncbi:MAG: hypothetical protein IKO72_07595 [Kiritimatiellae bacterium]|nr:hypothetical protein [Kiritimatiellia bacterium]
MFVKLTQLNGKPIWINQEFIVTVEPGRSRGSIVVPLGDDLDYEVGESPDAVVEALGGTVVPSAPASRSAASAAPSAPVAPPAEQPDFRIESGLIVKPDAKAESTAAKPDPAPKKTTRKTAKTAAAEKKPAAKAKAAPRKAASRKKAAPPPVPLDESQLARLQKMSPGTMRKLVNTLISQFAVTEASVVIDALVANGLISVTDQGHVDWNWRNIEEKAKKEG